MITINVLACGELFQHTLNALAAFMKDSSFLTLLKIANLVGIMLATVGYLKERNPLIYIKWFLGYVFFIYVVLTPKTDVLIQDISRQINYKVDNVPVAFALPVSLITWIGYGSAQLFDSYLTMPDDLQYTRTGALFGSRLIMATKDFRILNPVLKEEMNDYLRSCVVGDMKLNRKYSFDELENSTNIWQLISAKASPLRMTMVNGKLVSCLEAAKPEGEYSLYKQLMVEINKAYRILGIRLFSKPEETSYEALFENHLASAFNYYQDLSNSSSEIFLQTMMINAMQSGIKNYQAYTDATAGIVNQQFSKAQAQDRWSWEIGGLKALWFLPLLHTLMMVVLFGIFPIIMVLATLPSCLKVVSIYFRLFASLQLWPVMFAILNAAMTIYTQQKTQQYGFFTMINIDKLDELHSDISGIAGYLMLSIPVLSYMFFSNLESGINSLSHGMTSQVQNTANSSANDAVNGSFSLGQTSFYNTSGNNFSANKHDSNWTHLHGMHTQQMASGALKTTTGDGSTVFDVGPGMSRSGISINASKALSGSFTEAYEQSKQAAMNESQHYQSSLANFAHRAVQFSELQGKDIRFGEGVSESDSGQYSKAIASMNHIASEVAKRNSTSTEEAMASLTSAGVSGHVGLSSDKSFIGTIGKAAFGIQGGVDTHAKFEGTATTNDRYHEDTSSGITAREARDFNEALNVVSNFTKTHHFDETGSKGASLSSQMGADLREAQTASRNYDASLSKAERIHHAQSFVESNSDQVSADLNQAFSNYVGDRLGKQRRDELFSQPGNTSAISELQGLGEDFIANRRDDLIARYGTAGKGHALEKHYHQEVNTLRMNENELGGTYQHHSETISTAGHNSHVGLPKSSDDYSANINERIKDAHSQLQAGADVINRHENDKKQEANRAILSGKNKAERGTKLPNYMLDKIGGKND